MTIVTVHQAKTHLSRLIADALAGKEVIIARRDQPVVRLVPVDAAAGRTPGQYKGQFTVPAAFLAPLSDEELALWEGGESI